MIINYLKSDALELLEKNISANVDKYTTKNEWLEEFFTENEMPSYSFNTGINVPDISLIIGDSKTDVENAKILYEALKDAISPIQASDLRLWAALAHMNFWEYMSVRWSIENSDEDDEDEKSSNKLEARIATRYFFGASKGKAFARQGIARLYWSAYLTYDEENPNNPYEYTEYLFSKQDLFVALTERQLARNKVLILAILKVLKQQGDLKREVIRRYILRINQSGGLVVLDALTPEDAYDFAKSILEEVLSEEENSDISNEVKDATEEDNDENHEDFEEVIQKNSIVIAENVSSGRKMCINILKNKLQTKPRLEGLKAGQKFKIGKENWLVKEIKNK